jgi:hypothetical protein
LQISGFGGSDGLRHDTAGAALLYEHVDFMLNHVQVPPNACTLTAWMDRPKEGEEVPSVLHKKKLF